MKFRIFVSIIVAALAVDTAYSGEKLVLLRRGARNNAKMVLPSGMGASTRYAADELKRCLNVMTGVELEEVVGKAQPPTVAIELKETGEYGSDGFRLKVSGSSLVVAGGRRGVLYGVYELLERYGIDDVYIVVSYANGVRSQTSQTNLRRVLHE